MVNKTKNPKELCPRCAQGKLVTDNESGEMFCSKCGFVITDKLQESGPEWRSFTQDEHGDRARAGAPTSLTMHDMGLATIINPRLTSSRAILSPTPRKPCRSARVGYSCPFWAAAARWTGSSSSSSPSRRL